MTLPSNWNETRLKTFQNLLKEYEKALEEGTIQDYQVEIYKKNVEYFKEVIKGLQGVLSKEIKD